MAITLPGTHFTGTVNSANGFNATGGLFYESTTNAATATGSSRTGAYALTTGITNFTTVAANTGAVLPASTGGENFTIFNNGANTLTLYATGSDTINGTAGATGISVLVGQGADVKSPAAGTWLTADDAATGSFTSLTVSGATVLSGSSTLSPANANVVISPTGTGTFTVNPATAGTLNNVSLGATTPLAVTSTTLTATGAVALSPANLNVVLSPTGTGVVTINPATAGTLNNLVIGGSTPLAVTSTTLTATGAVALSPAGLNVVLSPTGAGVVTVNPATAGTINNCSIGATTPLAGTFTTVAVNNGTLNVGLGTGTAGTVSIFPGTTTTGKVTLTTSANSGNTITAVNVAAQAGARTYTVPDTGSATSSVAMTRGNTVLVTDIARCTASVTANNTAAYANVTGLTGTVVVGTYRFRVVLPSTVASGTGGLKYAFNYTTTVLSSIEATGMGYTAAAVAVQHTTTTTTQTDIFTQAAVVIMTVLEGTFVVSTGGTIDVQMAQNTANASNSITLIGSSFELTRIA